VSIGYFFDCHNTLINSNDAWIQAFCEFIGKEHEDKITKELYGKFRRREIAIAYGVKFELIEEAANKYMMKNKVLIDLLNNLKRQGSLLFVVSNAPKRRVISDLENIGIIDLFDNIFTSEDGGKQNDNIFSKVLEKYNLEYGLFMGNEEYEDHITHPNIVSFALTEFVRKRNYILRDYVRLDHNGRLIE
jgi:FMN phosphatase YigB (HAD superfamily)